MSLGTQKTKIAHRLERAVKKASNPHNKRKQNSTYDSDDELEAAVEWGQRLDSHGGSGESTQGGLTPSTRRVTRHSGMTNKDLYKSVVVNGTEYFLGQAVQVRSSSEEPYLATIYKLWENEKGEKQVVARWLLRKNEMFLGRKMHNVQAEPDEVFYSNADDLIKPDMILAPLKVLSYEEYKKTQTKQQNKPIKKSTAKYDSDSVRFCRSYFNEQTAFIGNLDWDKFYNGKELLDSDVQDRMFKQEKIKKDLLSKGATTKIGLAKAAARRSRRNTIAAVVPKTSKRGTKRQKTNASDDEVDSEGIEEDSDYSNEKDNGDEDDMLGVKASRSVRRSDSNRKIAVRTPTQVKRVTSTRRMSSARLSTPATTPRRRMRLQDIQPAAVSAIMLKRASRMGNSTSNPQKTEDGKTIYEVARQRLHVSAIPDTLPCREDEFAEIYGHLYNTIEERNSMCMYISGVPGTGKTATVHEVIRSLQENAEEGDLSEFQYIELNGMKMTEPSQAYTQLWQAITGEKATPKHAAQLLEKHFSTPSPRRHTYVVLMDELDLLVTKSQSIMYNFFDWPHRPHAKLIVIAIANTMDLPERMLHHKVSSRLGLTRINFQPYSHQQLMTIVQSRLEGCMAFDGDAIELCARKISAVSGDARRALDVCRRAVEIVEEDWQRDISQTSGKRPRNEDTAGKKHLVTMMIIDRAVKEMYASGHISFVQNASVQQKVFLISLRAAIRKAGIPEVPLGDVAFIHRQLCQMHKITVPSYDQISKICSQLGATRCILTESSILDVHQQVRLAIAEDDIAVALRPDPLFHKIAVS